MPHLEITRDPGPVSGEGRGVLVTPDGSAFPIASKQASTPSEREPVSRLTVRRAGGKMAPPPPPSTHRKPSLWPQDVSGGTLWVAPLQVFEGSPQFPVCRQQPSRITADYRPVPQGPAPQLQLSASPGDLTTVVTPRSHERVGALEARRELRF